MGTHPIFESDFDCLTDVYRNEPMRRTAFLFWPRILMSTKMEPSTCTSAVIVDNQHTNIPSSPELPAIDAECEESTESQLTASVEKAKQYQNDEISRLTENPRGYIEQFIDFPTYLEDPNDDDYFAITDAIIPINERKNRYIDILPYDRTRVKLQGENDYINANYVTMEPGSELPRKWIASQGPLEHTTADFWRMIRQNDISLIVMVTQLAERNRQKCHQYWPSLSEKLNLESEKIEIIMTEESEQEKGVVERNFEMTDVDDQKRIVKQLQFVTWPDHGVPNDPSDFMDFVLRVNELKNESPESTTLVHCSAGVGRTGVTIMVDAAIENIRHLETNEPLLLLSEMRQQRPCLIQTPIQFKFVCDTIVLFTSYLWPITPNE